MGIFNSKPVEPKIILITGASSGIGKETAMSLIERGHVVYGCARRVNKMQDIVQAGGHAIAMDVCNDQEVAQGVKRIMSEQGRIDVLVNNAGFAAFGSIEDVDMEQAQRQFNVNLFGVARLTKQVVPYMRKQEGGSIINMSSYLGKVQLPFGAWYVASKHALEGWSDCLRLELKPFNIKVAIIQPGITRTEFSGIWRQSMLDCSKGNVYEKFANNFQKEGAKLEQEIGSPCSLIAPVIVKAVEAKNPKRRYVVGAFARPMMFIRSWFGDTIFDAIMGQSFAIEN